MAKATDPGNNAGRNAERPTVPLASESSGSVAGFFAGLALLVVVTTARLVAKVWHGLTADGTLAAFMRQGADEVGAALKAFPDSIQQHETGTIWNPTQGEVASRRAQGRHSGSYISFSHHTWPSEIAREHKHRPEPETGRDRGHDAGHSL